MAKLQVGVEGPGRAVRVPPVSLHRDVPKSTQSLTQQWAFHGLAGAVYSPLCLLGSPHPCGPVRLSGGHSQP